MTTDTIAWLVLRVIYAWMFLYPLHTLLKDWDGTVGATALLFKWQPKFFAMISTLAMVLGGLSILFGFYGQIGGLLLLIFNLGGAVVHYRLKDLALAQNGDETLTKLAVVGHMSSAQKNFVLAAVAFFFMLIGTGPHSITPTLLF